MKILIENIVKNTIKNYIFECKRDETPLQHYSNNLLTKIYKFFYLNKKRFNIIDVKIEEGTRTVYLSWEDIQDPDLLHQFRISDHEGKLEYINKQTIYNENNKEYKNYAIDENHISTKKIKNKIYNVDPKLYVFDIRKPYEFKDQNNDIVYKFKDLLTTEYSSKIHMYFFKNAIYDICSILCSFFNKKNNLNYEYALNYDEIESFIDKNYSNYFESKKYLYDIARAKNIVKNENERRLNFLNSVFKIKLYRKCLLLFYFLSYKLTPLFNNKETIITKNGYFTDFCTKYLHIYVTPQYVDNLINNTKEQLPFHNMEVPKGDYNKNIDLIEYNINTIYQYAKLLLKKLQLYPIENYIEDKEFLMINRNLFGNDASVSNRLKLIFGRFYYNTGNPYDNDSETNMLNTFNINEKDKDMLELDSKNETPIDLDNIKDTEDFLKKANSNIDKESKVNNDILDLDKVNNVEELNKILSDETKDIDKEKTNDSVEKEKSITDKLKKRKHINKKPPTYTSYNKKNNHWK